MTNIGNSPLDVYPLCLGTNPFGWTADESVSHSILDEYTGAGGNFLDTADIYANWVPGNSGGESEEIIGSWLAKKNRDELVVATKVGRMKGRTGLSTDSVNTGVEASLKRLGTDYIDLYYAHEPDPNTPLEESVAVFAELQKSGKIREIGLSNFNGNQVSEWIEEADRQGVPRPVALQPHYNLVWRQSFEGSLQFAAEEYDLGVMPYWSLGAGLLTGKYRSAEEISGSRAATLEAHANPRAFEVVNALAEIAGELNVEPATVAIAWLLTKPVVTAPIASASRADQVPALLEGVSVSLSDQEILRLDELSEGLGGAD